MKNEILINLYYDKGKKGTGKMLSCTRLQTSLLEKSHVSSISRSASAQPCRIVPILRMLIFKRGAELNF